MNGKLKVLVGNMSGLLNELLNGWFEMFGTNWFVEMVEVAEMVQGGIKRALYPYPRGPF